MKGTAATHGDERVGQTGSFADPARDPSLTRLRAWRGAEMPATNGHGNARAIAQLHSVLSQRPVWSTVAAFLSEARLPQGTRTAI